MSVSESDLNAEIAQRLAEHNSNRIQLVLDQKAREEKTLDLVLTVKRVDIDLSAESGGLVKINLDTAIKGSIEAFGRAFSMTTDIVPKLESGVRIEEDRVYLVAPRLTEVSVQGTNFSDQMLRSTLGRFHTELEEAIARYFSQHPIYVLDHNGTEKLAAKLIEDIEITDDALEFILF